MMIEKRDIENYKDRYVGVGIPHDFIPNKLFFYYGYLSHIDGEVIKIDMKHGFKLIPYKSIKDIHLTNNR